MGTGLQKEHEELSGPAKLSIALLANVHRFSNFLSHRLNLFVSAHRQSYWSLSPPLAEGENVSGCGCQVCAGCVHVAVETGVMCYLSGAGN